MKLQMKILLPMIALIVLLCGLSGYMSYRNAADDLERALESNLRGEAEGLARAVSTMMQGVLQDVRRIARRDEITGFYRNLPPDAAQKEQIVADLKEIEDSYPGFERVHLLNTKGVVIASSDPNNMGKSYADRNYFQAAVKGRFFLSPPLQSRLTGGGVMVASAPVTQDGTIVGVIYCPFPLNYLYKTAVAPVSVMGTGYAYILDRNGQLVVHRDPELLFNPDLHGKEHYKFMGTTDKDGTLDFVGAARKRFFAYHAREPISGLTAVAQADHATVFAGLKEMRNKSVMIALGGMVFATLMIMFILRPVLRDINAGMVFAGKVADGDLSGTLAVSRKDELGRLAGALQAIPRSLKRIIAEYRNLETNIEGGTLQATGDAGQFSGEFAELINGTNAILSRFAVIMDAIPTPMLMLDEQQNTRYMNAVARDLAGADYNGKSYADLFRPEDQDQGGGVLARAIASAGVRTGETTVRPGGRVMEISYTAIPLLNPKGELASVLLLMIDLTQVKSTQRTILEVATQALDIADRVAAASEELSAQVEQVSHGTDVQRDRAASTATAMEEMNATVLEVARSAGQASEQADAAREKAARGAETVGNVISAVQRVNAMAEELQNNMRDLGNQAKAIGGVMNVISDIADQTNLLALNAAIEAARAGDAGRGFAVVADEVRKLAEKTMAATHEVGASIKGIQEAAALNIRRVGEAGGSVTQAAELAGTSGAALEEIVDLVGKNSALIANIATAAEEQSATSEEINGSVEEINRIAGETATGMNQSAAAVQELARMAQELRALLDKLRG